MATGEKAPQISDGPGAKPMKITAMPVADLAKALASAYGRRVTEQQVREVADRAGLIRPDDTISLLEYVAFLVAEMAHGSD